MEDLTAWLRATIEGDLAQAKAADEAAPGPWVNTGQAGEGDAWQIHGANTDPEEVEWSDEVQDLVPVGCRVATLNYDDGGGVWEKAAADHMVLQQPWDTIARCEAELELLDLHKPGEYGECVTCHVGAQSCGCCGWGDFPCDTVQLLARGYRHRPGFKPSFLEPAPVEVPFDWVNIEAAINDGQVIDLLWRDASIASAKTRKALGLDATMAEARSIPHPFTPAEGPPYDRISFVRLDQFCAACGCIRPLIAHSR